MEVFLAIVPALLMGVCCAAGVILPFAMDAVLLILAADAFLASRRIVLCFLGGLRQGGFMGPSLGVPLAVLTALSAASIEALTLFC